MSNGGWGLQGKGCGFVCIHTHAFVSIQTRTAEYSGRLPAFRDFGNTSSGYTLTEREREKHTHVYICISYIHSYIYVLYLFMHPPLNTPGVCRPFVISAIRFPDAGGDAMCMPCMYVCMCISMYAYMYVCVFHDYRFGHAFPRCRRRCNVHALYVCMYVCMYVCI